MVHKCIVILYKSQSFYPSLKCQMVIEAALITKDNIYHVNVNVNVISRTALIRNRVSRRVCTCACHVWVSSIYFKRPEPISFPS